MAELIVNEFTVNRPIGEAWPVLCDVEQIAPCLPGAELQEIEGEVYRGVVKVKLGAVSTQFKGQAHFVDRDDTAHVATLRAEVGATPPPTSRPRPRSSRPRAPGAS
jgi:carbon monoxide dehydrogenase subunit G